MQIKIPDAPKYTNLTINFPLKEKDYTDFARNIEKLFFPKNFTEKEYSYSAWVLGHDGPIYDKNNYITYEYNHCIECTTGIRPAIKPDSFSEIGEYIVDNNGEDLIIEYGSYPQTLVSETISKELEKQYKTNNLKETGNHYTINGITPIKKSGNFVENQIIFKPIELKEYEYNGNKYVRQGYVEEWIGLKEYKAFWYKVEPIRWTYNDQTGEYQSDKVLLTNIQFSKKGIYQNKEDYPKTFMYEFLNKYFSKEISPNKTKDSSKIVVLIESIYDYLEKIKEEEAKSNYQNQLEVLVTNFNNKLNDLKIEKSKYRLTINNLNNITIEMELDLEDLLNKIKKYQERYKNYYNLIEIIDEYISILNGNKIENDNKNVSVFNGNIRDVFSGFPLYDTGIENGNELSIMFKNINNKCLPFLKEEEREQIKNKIITVLNKEKEKIFNYITKDEELSFNTEEEMNLDIRSNIHPILEELNIEVNNRDLELEIINSIKEIIEGNFKIPKNKILKNSLTELNNTYNKLNLILKELPINQQEEYKQTINDIMNTEINYNQDALLVTKDIGKINSKLAIILIDIESYLKEINDINNSFIDLNTIKKK